MFHAVNRVVSTYVPKWKRMFRHRTYLCTLSHTLTHWIDHRSRGSGGPPLLLLPAQLQGRLVRRGDGRLGRGQRLSVPGERVSLVGVVPGQVPAR